MLLFLLLSQSLLIVIVYHTCLSTVGVQVFPVLAADTFCKADSSKNWKYLDADGGKACVIDDHDKQ